VDAIPKINYRFLKIFSEYIEKTNPSIVILRSPVDLICFIFILKCLCKKNNIKIVYEAHSSRLSPNILFSILLKFPFSFFLSKVNLLIAVSDLIIQQEQYRKIPLTVKCYPGHSMKNSIISNENFTSEVQIVFVGRFAKEKNPMLLLRAIKKRKNSLRKVGVVFNLIGSGPLDFKMRQFIARYNLSDLIRIQGFQKDVGSWLSSADYIVSSSRFEGFPVAILEARYFGLPLIKTPWLSDHQLLTKHDFFSSSFRADRLGQTILEAASLGKTDSLTKESIRESFLLFTEDIYAINYYNSLKTSFDY